MNDMRNKIFEMTKAVVSLGITDSILLSISSVFNNSFYDAESKSVLIDTSQLLELDVISEIDMAIRRELLKHESELYNLSKVRVNELGNYVNNIVDILILDKDKLLVKFN